MQNQPISKDTCNIFYSWQSDIKNSRHFLSDCLKRLPSKLKEFVIVKVDRDTQGLAGSPDIGDSIYDKIEHADIFVADVTIINKNYVGRKTPNPNVLIELGYAIKCLGWDRIILLFNAEEGDVEELPFDINHQRMTKYSLREESKQEAQNRIINNITATVQLLKSNGRLHGGEPKIMQCRRDLASILLEGMTKIFQYFVLEEISDAVIKADFLTITSAQIAKIEEIRTCLSDTQYLELSSLLQKMSMWMTGEESDREFAINFAVEYFEPVFYEYVDRLYFLELEQVLKKEVIELFNTVSPNIKLEYQEERFINGTLKLKISGDYVEAYDKEGSLLCKGTHFTGAFTGYRLTNSYIGEFKEGFRDGYGKEKANVIGGYHYQCGEFRREGHWEKDLFLEGTIYAVLIYKDEEGQYSFEEDVEDHEMPMTADSRYMHFLIDGMSPEEKAACYLCDMDYKHGEFDIREGSIRELESREKDEEIF